MLLETDESDGEGSRVLKDCLRLCLLIQRLVTPDEEPTSRGGGGWRPRPRGSGSGAGPPVTRTGGRPWSPGRARGQAWERETRVAEGELFTRLVCGRESERACVWERVREESERRWGSRGRPSDAGGAALLLAPPRDSSLTALLLFKRRPDAWPGRLVDNNNYDRSGTRVEGEGRDRR